MSIDRDLPMHAPATTTRRLLQLPALLRTRRAGSFALAASALLLLCAPPFLAAQNLRFVPTVYTVQAFHGLLSGPGGMAVDPEGRIYVADTAHSRVWMMDTTKTVALYAGRGTTGYAGDNSPAVSATLNAPQAVATDLAGDVYIADTGNSAVRRVDAVTGTITTIAGGNGAGSTGDNGPATAAKLTAPSGLAIDAAGNVYVSDSAAAVVRRISTAGIITTVAGGGAPASGNGDGGPATSASLQAPSGLAIDAAGTLYIADATAGLVRKVSGGVISTFAGSTTGFTINTAGFGGPATSARLHSPRALAVDSSGSVYLTDSYLGLAAVVDGTGTINALAGLAAYGSVGDGLPASEVSLAAPNGMAVDASGNVFLSSNTQNAVYQVIQHPERFPFTSVGASSGPQRLVLENFGTANITLSQVAFTGDFAVSSTLLANANPCTATKVINTGFGNSCTLDVVFTPTVPGIRTLPLTITSNDSPSTLTLNLTSTGLSAALATTGGDMYTVAGLYPGDQLHRGDNIPATQATLNGINGLITDSMGDVILTEYGYCQIRRVDAKTGIISTLAGVNPDTCANNAGSGPNGDGGPATQATLYLISGLAYGADGTLYVSDSGHYKIRSIDPQGIIHTFAGTGSNICAWAGDGKVAAATAICGGTALAIDANGNMYYTDGQNEIVAKISPAGILTRLAGVPSLGSGSYSGDGGQAVNAHLNSPWGLALDKAGNVYFSDRANEIVRRVDAATGIITTVAGTPGVQGYSGDGGPATSATLNFAAGVTVDAAGNLYIADSGNYVVRKVDAATGIITTIGGNFVLGGLYNGDGLPATETAVNYPETITVDPAGHVLLGDLNRLIREISPNGTLRFGAQNVNTTSAAQTLTISNIGNTPMHFNATAPYTVVGDFAFVSGGTCNFAQPLAPGASCTVQIAFTPTAVYTRYGALALFDDGVASPQLTQLVGVGSSPSAPQAVLSPSALPFGNQNVNTTSAVATVTVSNPGTSALTIAGISIIGPDATAFAQTSTCGATLAVSAQCTISVTFTPSSAKAFSAALALADNASGSPQTVTLSGTGVSQQALAVLTPASIAFPATSPGTTTASQTIVLSNPGTAALAISGIALAGTNTSAFNLVSSCGQSLAAGASCNLAVTFAPAASSSYSAAIVVTDNAPGSPQSATLSGTGVAAPTFLATLTPASVSFGNQLSGTSSAPQTLTLTNTGTGGISIAGVTLAGANATAFTLANSCGSMLAAGAHCSIAVTFAPTASGALSATVSVADNASGSPQTAALTGTGTLPPDFTTASPTPPQVVAAGGAASYLINVTSVSGNFNLPVTLTATGLPPGATAAFTPAVVTPGSAGATSTMSVQTASVRTAGLPAPSDPRSTPELLVTAVLACLLCMRRIPRITRTSRIWMLLGVLALLSLGVSGCGGGFPQPANSNTYVITVTGSNGTDQHAATVTLTVQ